MTTTIAFVFLVSNQKRVLGFFIEGCGMQKRTEVQATADVDLRASNPT